MQAGFETLPLVKYADLKYYFCYFPEVVVLFTMKNCFWCTEAIPEMEKAMKQLRGNIPVVQVLFDDDKSLAKKEQIQGFPTCRRYKKNKTFTEHEGERTAQSYLKFISPTL
jgi:thioredoxin-like negative regulator of GroEL